MNCESKSVKYETLRDSIGSSVTNTAIHRAYTSSNTTFNFNRQDGGTVTLNFNPSINALFRRRHFLDQYRSNTELEWDHLSTNDSGHGVP